MFTYIFSKAYFFYVRVFREKDIPHWFASAILALLWVMNVIVLLNLFLYLVQPEIIKEINVYYKYFALVLLLVTIFYMSYGGRYQLILKTFEELSRKRKRTLGILSLIYISLLFCSFFYIGELIRIYNSGI